MLISTDNGTLRNAFGDMAALRLIREAGFDGVDYTFYDMTPQSDILSLPLPERRALAADLKAYAQSVGLTFPQSHASLKLLYTEGKDSKNYQDILRSMEFAAWLGCKQIVIHTLRFPREDRSIPMDRLNRDFLRGFLPLAEELDLYIGVENLFWHDTKRACYFGRQGTPEEMNAFVDSLESDRFRVCCDLGHCALTGVEPQDFLSGMRAERMTMIHVQDTDYRGDRHVLPYMGAHAWDQVTQALADIDFQGSMNLEALHYYEMFPRELLPAALRLAADTARYLADQVEAKRAQARLDR